MFLAVFRNRTRADIDAEAYKADLARMETLAGMQPGFISFKCYTADDGEVVAISEWTSEAAVESWGTHPEHDLIIRRGRSKYYQNYTMFACSDPSVRNFHRGDA